MKKIVSALLILSLMVGSASAQNENKSDRPNRGDKGQNYNRFNPRLLDQLSLTSTQSEQIKIINDDYRAKMQDMIKSDLSVDDRKSKRNVYDTERRTKVLAILTPAQVQKFHELQKAQGSGDEKEVDYKIKTKNEDGEKTKIKVKTEID